MNKHAYGFRKSLPNLSNKQYSEFLKAVAPSATVPVTSFNLSQLKPLPPVYNQAQTNSCTGNAMAGCLQYLTQSVTPSRLFIYYNERLLQGTVNQDDGATIDISVQAVKQYGECPETMWQFNTQDVMLQPNPECYVAAKKHLLLESLQINTIDEIKHSIVSGFPVIFGFQVYSYMESEQMALQGVLRVPLPTEQYLGGHAVVVVGFDDAEKMLTIRNSWGEQWGLKGYFKMPYDYASNINLASDFYSIQNVEE